MAKVKIKYASLQARMFPALGKEFPYKDDEKNIIEIEEEQLQMYLALKVGKERLFEKVKVRRVKKEPKLAEGGIVEDSSAGFIESD